MFRRNHGGGGGGDGDGGGDGGGDDDTNGGATSTTSSTSTTTIHSSRHRIRRKQRNVVLGRISPYFQQHYMVKSEKDKMTLLLIVIMFLLAGGLLRILYQIWSALSASSSGRFYFSGSRGIYRRGRGSWPGGNEKGGREHAVVVFPNMPFNPIYKIPEAHDKVGDRSDSYARLRQQVDTQLPADDQRSLLAVHRLKLLDYNNPHNDKKDGNKIRSHVMDPSSMFYQSQQDGDLVVEPYDVYNCPDIPPLGYPFQWNLVHEILHDWPVNDYGGSSSIPKNEIYNGLCIFDYTQDYDKALRYRRAEKPFVVDHDPHVARTVERWAMVPNYMEQLLGKDVLHRGEYNTNNHFLYSMPKRAAAPIKRNTRNNGQQQEPHELQDLHGRPAKLQNQAASPNAIRMTYRDWLSKANVTNDNNTVLVAGPNDEHWYFRLVGCGYLGPDGSCDKGSSEYLFDELPYFQPNNDTLYMGNGDEQKGIHCRFGMPGVLAENHFDGSRNAIVVLRGMRRYILSHPNQCDKLALLPMGHASARHSAIDYTQPDLQLYPEFEQAMANEVVLQAGQVLYLPTNWFHYIVSLNLNMQCNARSGETDHYKEPIEACGF